MLVFAVIIGFKDGRVLNLPDCDGVLFHTYENKRYVVFFACDVQIGAIEQDMIQAIKFIPNRTL